ncbi:MAG: hydroxyethylthiazole kinase [Bacillota bacterium]|nr:hydroxyethylthiazole kinase [Bacillota bacterium]
MHLIHIISNEVSLNLVVNSVLASGGTAICATAPEEVQEITEISDALVLNTGIPGEIKFRSLLSAGKKANAVGIPVVLDPVGVGASSFRNEGIKLLLNSVRFACIKGNYAEIAYLCGINNFTGGVDAGSCESTNTLKNEMKRLSRELNCTVIATGRTTIQVTPSDAEESYVTEVAGGSALLSKITGSGCVLTALLGLFLAGAEEAERSEKITDCLRYYKDCAEEAEQYVHAPHLGTGSFQTALIDAMSRRSGVFSTADKK